MSTTAAASSAAMAGSCFCQGLPPHNSSLGYDVPCSSNAILRHIKYEKRRVAASSHWRDLSWFLPVSKPTFHPQFINLKIPAVFPPILLTTNRVAKWRRTKLVQRSLLQASKFQAIILCQSSNFRPFPSTSSTIVGPSLNNRRPPPFTPEFLFGWQEDIFCEIYIATIK